MQANASVCARILELQTILSAGVVALEIGSRNARVQALQARWVQLRARVALLLTERGAEMAETPGGASGLLMLDFKGKESTPVYRVDTGLVSLLSELRAHERQAATELEQWNIWTVVDPRDIPLRDRWSSGGPAEETTEWISAHDPLGTLALARGRCRELAPTGWDRWDTGFSVPKWPALPGVYRRREMAPAC